MQIQPLICLDKINSNMYIIKVCPETYCSCRNERPLEEAPVLCLDKWWLCGISEPCSIQLETAMLPYTPTLNWWKGFLKKCSIPPSATIPPLRKSMTILTCIHTHQYLWLWPTMWNENAHTLIPSSHIHWAGDLIHVLEGNVEIEHPHHRHHFFQQVPEMFIM